MENATNKLICAGCGSQAECFHRDLAGEDYNDEYTLYCKHCGHIERQTRYGGSSFASNWRTECPYCGVDCVAHESAPRELWGCARRFLPLFKFKLAGKDFAIDVRDEKVEMKAIYNRLRLPVKELDIPLPAKKMPTTRPDVFGEIKLEFSILDSGRISTEIKILIRYRQYSEKFRKEPPVILAKKRLLVTLEREDYFSAKWQEDLVSDFIFDR